MLILPPRVEPVNRTSSSGHVVLSVANFASMTPEIHAGNVYPRTQFYTYSGPSESGYFLDGEK